MEFVRNRIVPVFLFVALVSACGHERVTGPSITSVAGEWHGMFTVTACSFSGQYTECGLSAGVTRPAVLLLAQDGETVSGTAVYGTVNLQSAPDWYHPFATTLEKDGRLQILTGWGRSPTFVTTLEWDLHLAGRDHLQGTLTATDTWYKIRGATISEGVVELTRRY